ncbi:hypothetical protein [Nannocystis bainbridge]|uniref:Uncharacterized protein n=1 Tax=Nannocystis bainbridge TaxID=2995303 RepID=A0ABT5DXS6_9BACT|nr:hypothetical protein [Nannocystis bainbridge]MDC0718417.1 hypothetical protein [Nannocystis bainbridge]
MPVSFGRSVLLLAAFASCSPRPHAFEDSAGDTTGSPATTSTSTTGMHLTSTSAGEPTSGTSGEGTSSTSTSDDPVFIAPPDLGDGPPECDPWVPACPEGQKCMPYSGDGDSAWESWGCFEKVPDPDLLGEPCTNFGDVSGLDSCDAGHICWVTEAEPPGSTCIAMCTGSPEAPQCADPLTTCNIAADYAVILCLPMCDPLLQDCRGTDLCIPKWPWTEASEFTCALDASGDEGQVFDPCEYGNECDLGLLCHPSALADECDPRATGCCLPFCDVTQPNSCPGAGQECVSWYEPDAAPPLDAIGTCRLP